MWKDINSFFHLSRKEKSLLIQIYLFIRLVNCSLRLFGFKKTRSFLFRRLQNRSLNARLYSSEQIIWSVNCVSSRMPVTCLPKALTAMFFLKKNSYNPKLMIGVRSNSDHIDAHAWLTLDDNVVLGHLNNLHEYTVLLTDCI